MQKCGATHRGVTEDWEVAYRYEDAIGTALHTRGAHVRRGRGIKTNGRRPKREHEASNRRVRRLAGVLGRSCTGIRHVFYAV